MFKIILTLIPLFHRHVSPSPSPFPRKSQKPHVSSNVSPVRSSFERSSSRWITMDDPSVGQSSGIKPETANFDQPPRILDNSPTLSRITFPSPETRWENIHFSLYPPPCLFAFPVARDAFTLNYDTPRSSKPSLPPLRLFPRGSPPPLPPPPALLSSGLSIE